MEAVPYHPQTGEKISAWGYSFTWSDDHLPRKETEPLRQQHDTLGAEALKRLQTIQASFMEDSKAKGIPPSPVDLYALLRDHRQNDDVLSQFWEETHTVPDWVDWEQLARAQKFFYRYAIANIVGFALQGFVAENSASPGVVEVLVRTGGFSTRALLGRLLETFQWLIQVTKDLAAIQPGGEGHVATIRVRLLHSSVRQRILKLCQTRPNYFDTEQFGIPINTLDSVHSISTFSCNQLWLQLPKFGIQPSEQECEDYVALFRYLAYVIGTPTSYFETSAQAKLVMESLLVHELRTTETSRVVLYNFMECVGNLPHPFHVSKQFIEAGSRWINGDEHCDSLNLGKPWVLYYLVFLGHCILVTGLAWAQRLIPGVDEAMIKFFRWAMYQGVVLRKSRTRFNFQYVPQMGKCTGREKHTADAGDLGGHKPLSLRWPDLSVVTNMGYFEMVLLFVTIGTGVALAWGLCGALIALKARLAA